MPVDDLRRREEAREPQHRPGDEHEQAVNRIGVAAPTGQQGEDALAEQEQQRDLDEGTQRTEQEKFRMAHDMFASSFREARDKG